MKRAAPSATERIPSERPAVLLLSLAVIAALAFWGARYASATSPVAAPPRSDRTLRVWMMGYPADSGDIVDGQVQPGMRDIISVFEKMNPGTTVQYQDIGWDNAFEKIMTSMISGGPDVYMLGTTWVGQFAQKGALLKLDNYISRDKFPLKDYFDRYIEIGKVKGFKDTEPHWYGMPFVADTRLLFFDKHIFDHYKVPYPHDAMKWEELQDLAHRTTGTDPVTGRHTYGYIIHGNDPVFQYMGFLYQHKGRFYQDDETHAALDTPQAIEALTFLSDFETKYHTSGPGTASYFLWNTMAPFAASDNDKAMIEGVPSEIVMAVERYPQRYGVCTLPVREQSGCLMGGSLLAINQKTTHREEAWDFLKFMASEQVQKFMLEKMKQVVPMKRIRDWSYVKDNPGWEVAMRQCADGYNTPRTGWATSYNIIVEEVQAAVIGIKTPTEACKSMQKRIDTVLSQEAPPPYTEAQVTKWFCLAVGAALCVLAVWFLRSLRRAHPRGLLFDAKKGLVWYGFLIPGIMLLAAFLLFPVFESLRLSFLSSDGLNVYGGLGLRNFTTILSDHNFWKSVWNTAWLTCAEIGVGIPLGVTLAVLINDAVFGRTFFKVTYFIPVVPALIAVAIGWTLLFRADDRGVLNSLLSHLGVSKPVGWLSDPAVTKFSIVLMDTWKGVGLVVIIVLAGLQSIPVDLYEAARIDGAGSWQRFWYVTIPMLRPTLTFLIITSTIGCLQMFDQLYTLGDATGGPQRSFQTIVLYLYESGFANQRFGIASAVAYILFAIIVLLTYVNFRVLRPRAELDS